MKMRKMTALLLAACLAAVIPAAAPAEEEDTIVTIVHTPEQTEAERPPCFPDPTDNYIPLPETENVAEGRPVQASRHNDVYVGTNLNDGKTETYWESKGFPAEVTVELEGARRISAAQMVSPQNTTASAAKATTSTVLSVPFSSRDRTIATAALPSAPPRKE